MSMSMSMRMRMSEYGCMCVCENSVHVDVGVGVVVGGEWMGCMYISFMIIFMCYSIKEEVISNTAVGKILGISVPEGEKEVDVPYVLMCYYLMAL